VSHCQGCDAFGETPKAAGEDARAPKSICMAEAYDVPISHPPGLFCRASIPLKTAKNLELSEIIMEINELHEFDRPRFRQSQGERVALLPRRLSL
jgi:hypothetical protein